MQGNPSFNQAMNARESDSKKELKNSSFSRKFTPNHILYITILFFFESKLIFIDIFYNTM